MKKIFSIMLIALLLIGTVFAGTIESETQRVTVRSKVGTITVSEAATTAADASSKLYELFVGDSTAASANSKDVLVDADISDSDVVAYFRIHQNYKVKSHESVTLAISAGPLYYNGLTSTTDSDYTDAPVVSDITGNSITNALSVGSTAGTTTSEFTFNLEYSPNYGTTGVYEPVNDVNIGYFTYTWAEKAGLKNGTFISTITLTVATV